MDFKAVSDAHNKLVAQMNKFSQNLNQISKLEEIFVDGLEGADDKKVRESIGIMRKFILTEQENISKEIAKSPIWEYLDTDDKEE
jgi:hypothetical protein